MSTKLTLRERCENRPVLQRWTRRPVVAVNTDKRVGRYGLWYDRENPEGRKR